MRLRLAPAAALGRVGGEVLRGVAERQRDDEVEHRGERERREVLERLRADRVRLREHLGQGDLVGEGSGLEHLDGEADQRGQRDAQALRDDDVAHRVERVEAERLRRLALAAGHRLEAGAEQLARVRGGRQRDADAGRDEAREVEAELRDAVVDEVEEHERGDAAAELHDDDREPAHRAGLHGGADAEQRPEGQADDERDDRDAEGREQALEHLREPGEPVGEEHVRPPSSAGSRRAPGRAGPSAPRSRGRAAR